MRSLRSLALLLCLTGCLGDVDVPPQAPTLFPVETPTRRAKQTLEGTKPVDTAVLNRGEVVVPLDAEETWSFELDLVPGENQVSLRTQKASGKLSSTYVRAVIVFEPDFPGQPTLEPVDSPTSERAQALRGTKQAGTELVLDQLAEDGSIVDSQTIVPLDAETEWSHTLTVPDSDGLHRYSLVAHDDRGEASEPLDFTIELDRLAPAIVARYPEVDETGVPINTLISVGLDGPLQILIDLVDPEILVVQEGANRVSGSLIYNSLGSSLVFAGLLSADTTYTVTLDPTRFTDTAGNRTEPAPADWTWSFTTGSTTDDITPAAPTIDPPAGVSGGRTTLSELALTGSKDAFTALWINGNEVVSLGAATTWSASWVLAPDENSLEVTARGRSGLASLPANLVITRDLVRPSPPTVDPAPPASVEENVLVLAGTRDADTAIYYNSFVVVPRGPDTSWVYNADLVPGINEIELKARNAEGTFSEPVNLLVDFTQTYEGPVEAGFKLIISFSLRDLSRADPVRTTFDTGVNKYAVEAWVEGPLDAGETCSIDATTWERRNVKYVATIQHYIGQKENHTNPFHDGDYRAPDFLAALVTGGVFDSIGIGTGADRRDDATGYQGADLVDGSGKVKIDRPDLDLIDGVTEATVTHGSKVIEWLPLDRDFQRLRQGEYLINVALHLDRDPTWVASNDFETCWGDGAYAGVGQHRIVKRMGLGATPYTVRIGQAGELSAPDVERGKDQMRYLTPEGVTIRWAKTQ